VRSVRAVCVRECETAACEGFACFISFTFVSGQHCYNRLAVNFEYGSFPTTSAICAPSVCAHVNYPAHSAAEDSVQRQQIVAEARRQLQGTSGYVYVPGGMRITPDIARTGCVKCACARAAFVSAPALCERDWSQVCEWKHLSHEAAARLLRPGQSWPVMPPRSAAFIGLWAISLCGADRQQRLNPQPNPQHPKLHLSVHLSLFVMNAVCVPHSFAEIGAVGKTSNGAIRFQCVQIPPPRKTPSSACNI